MSNKFYNVPIYSYKNNREKLEGLRNVYSDKKGLYVKLNNKKRYVKRNPKTRFISFYL